MLVRFSVVAFVDTGERLGVVGSNEELGEWDSSLALPLHPTSLPASDVRPTFWTGVAEINDESDFEYKFVKWRRPFGSNRNIFQSTPITMANHLDLFAPDEKLRLEYSHFPHNVDEVQWEGLGMTDNRVFTCDWSFPVDLTGMPISERIQLTKPTARVHQKDDEANMVSEKEVWSLRIPDDRTKPLKGDWRIHNRASVYTLPSTHFVHDLSEFSQTTMFYNSVREANDIDYDQVLDKVYVGSCPRLPKHFDELKSKLKISCLMNFQAYEDIADNWPDADKYPLREMRSPSALTDIIKGNGFDYVWIPTTDMCPSSKARMVAQASFLLCGILANTNTTGVYVHCNAGVGRSSICVASFVVNCLGASMREANMLLCMRRPMAYFDIGALVNGSADYYSKFGDVGSRLYQESLKDNRKHARKNGAHKKPLESEESAIPGTDVIAN